MAHNKDMSGTFSTRRDFLKFSAASLATIGCGLSLPAVGAVLAPQAATQTGREVLIVGRTDVKTIKTNTYAVNNRPGPLCFLDVKSGTQRSIEVPFFAHAAIQNPARPSQFSAFEKWGTRGAMVDYNVTAVITNITALPDHVFYGHGIYDTSGRTLFSCEDLPGEKKDKRSGKIVLRDATTFQVIAQLSAYGARPHECRPVDNGKTMVVACEGGHEAQGCIAWIDIASGKLLNRIDYQTRQHIGHCHLAISHDNWICLGGSALAPGYKKVAFVSPDGDVLFPKVPDLIAEKMQTEALSIAFWGETNIVGVTMPVDNLVLIFDASTQELLGSIEDIQVNGIVPSLKETAQPTFIVSPYQRTPPLKEIALDEEGSVELADYPSPFWGNGSHLVRAFV